MSVCKRRGSGGEVTEKDWLRVRVGKEEVVVHGGGKKKEEKIGREEGDVDWKIGKNRK